MNDSVSAVRIIPVNGPQPYDIHIGPSLLNDGQLLTQHLRGRHVLLVSDDQVAPLYLEQVQRSLLAQRADLLLAQHIIPAGEASKTLDYFNTLIASLAEQKASRDACVLALGGGVVGDLAGFVAACWMRGIDCLQLPTSLLAMVDSSVGGKTAIDIPQGKNLVGAFHLPRAVIADTRALRTLPARQLRTGLAEVIKYGAIIDHDFLRWLDNQRDALLATDDASLTEAIARSCQHKAAIVERDPLEKAERALLNFGHSFAHAIETAQNYGAASDQALNHGEAVAVGMVLAARLSAQLGLSDPHDTDALQQLLANFGLPTHIPPGLAADTLLAHMWLDKKNQAGRLRLILWRGPGQAFIANNIDEAAVLNVLQTD